MPYFGLYKQTTKEYSTHGKRRLMYGEIIRQWSEHLAKMAKQPNTDFTEAITAVQRVKQHMRDHDTIANAYKLVEEAHEKTQVALRTHALVNEWRARAYTWAQAFRKKHNLPNLSIPAVE